MKKEKLYPRYKWRYLVQQACQKRHPQAPFMAEREATCVRTAPIRCWRDIGCMQLVQTSRDAASDVSGPRPHGSEVVSWRPRVLPLRWSRFTLTNSANRKLSVNKGDSAR